MRRLSWKWGAFLTVVLLGCGPSDEQVHLDAGPSPDEIARAEAAFSEHFNAEGSVDWSTEEVSTEVAGLLRLYAEYANAHHGDSLAGLLLMRRADLLQGRGSPDEAVKQWIDVVEAYPSSGLAAEAMFRIGFTRETALGDTTEALKAYTQLAQLHPESIWAEQALGAIKWLSFSEARMLDALEGHP